MQYSSLYKFTLALFCAASFWFLAQLTISIVQMVSMGTNPVYDLGEVILSHASRVLMVIGSNPIPTFVILTAAAIWLRSGMAFWIHLAMIVTAINSQFREILFLFFGMLNLRAILTLALEFGGLWLLYLLWRRGELIMRQKP